MTRRRTAFAGGVLVSSACGGPTTPGSDLTGTLPVVLSDNPGATVGLSAVIVETRLRTPLFVAPGSRPLPERRN